MRTPIFEDADLELFKVLKNKFVRAQLYEDAAQLRHIEKTLIHNIYEDNIIRLKNLSELETITKDQAKTLVELSTKALNDKVHQLEQRLNYANDQLSNLERKALDNVNLSVDYGQFLLENYVPFEMVINDGTKSEVTKGFRKKSDLHLMSENLVYSNKEVFEEFIDQKLKQVLEKKYPDNNTESNPESQWREM
jgi:hypothetical protein